MERIGRRRGGDRPLSMPGELSCDLERFSLHAKMRIEAADREGLERLCRYVARPPIQVDRLSLAADGRVIYALRWHWRDGTSAVAFEPLNLLSRLAALMPRPRAHLLTFHCVLTPAAEWREMVVPRARAKSSPGPEQNPASGTAGNSAHSRGPSPIPRELARADETGVLDRRAGVPALRRDAQADCGIPFATTPRRRCDSSLRDEPGLTSPTVWSCARSWRTWACRRSL